MQSLLLALLGCSVAARAKTVELWRNISYVEGANPSGLQARRVIGVNGTWPLPPVSVTQNDTLLIHAYNGLSEVGTALHSHGIYFNGTTYYDGAVGVTQCAIPPGETLTYNIPTDLQWGTYWLHGHYKGQYVDGLRTPFVIHPLAKEAHTYDEDYTIVVSDWYNDEHPVLLKQFLNKYNPTGAEPVPTAPLLYILPNNTFPSDTNGATGVFDGSAVGNNAVLRFIKGKVYRLRFINPSALAMFHIAIDGHQMQVIEVDGVETEAYNTTTFPLSVAQRISVLVAAREDTEVDSKDFALIANMDPDMFDQVPDDLQLNVTARITYSSSGTPNELQNATIFNEYPNFDETALVPTEVSASAPASVSHRLDANFDTYDDGTNRASFNNITYISPQVPSVITALTMPPNDSYLLATGGDTNQAYSRIYGAQTRAVTLSHMDNVEITIYNWDAGLHPFHLHGHRFQILQINQDATQGIPINESQSNPMRRDTIMVPPGGSATIRFRADNPGVWFFHCHIEWHLESGLAATFIEAPETMQSRKIAMPQEMLEQCSRQNIATSGNVVGTFSTTDFKGQPMGPYTQYHIIGWTPRAKGALAGCVLAALLGMLTIVWYSFGALDEKEVEEREQRRFDAAQATAESSGIAVLGKLKGVVGLRSRGRQ